MNRFHQVAIFLALLGLIGSLQRGADADDAKPAVGEAAPHRIELRVTDPQGVPIPHARIGLRGREELQPEQVLIGSIEQKKTYSTQVVANEVGLLTLQYPRPPQKFTFSVVTPGYGPYWAQWDQFPPTAFTAILEPAWTARGVVVDEAGNPIVGASVHPSIEFRKRPGNDFQLSLGSAVETNAQGEWEFSSVPVSMASLRVSVRHPDFATSAASVGPSQLQKIELNKGLVISGRVTDAQTGAPIAGAEVFTQVANVDRRSLTDGQGTFTLSGCDPNRPTKVVVAAPGKALTQRTVNSAEAMQPVNFALEPGGRVRIRVLDPVGNPVPKTRVFFQQWGGERIRYFEFRHVPGYTNELGVWEWNEAPLEGFAADICPPDDLQLPEIPFTPREEEYVVTTLPPLVFRGRVVDAQTREPIPEFVAIPTVHYGDMESSHDRRSVVEGRQGEFVLKHTRAYDGHSVRIEAKGYKSQNSKVFNRDAGEVRLEFELEPAVDVFAKILTPTGEIASGAVVALGVAGSSITMRDGAVQLDSVAPKAVADSDGRFRLPAPGQEYHLLITHSAGYAHLRSQDQQTDRIIVLSPWAKLEGTYRIGTEPQAGIALEFSSNSISNRPDEPGITVSNIAVTDAAGRFEFPKLMSGRGSLARSIVFIVDAGAQEAASTAVLPVELKNGVAQRTDLGGQGRTLIGQLAPPAGNTAEINWKQAQISLRPVDRNTRHFYHCSVAADGSFRIHDVAPGNYKLFVHISNLPIPPSDVPVDEGDSPLDLGIIR